jgi:hypothetical protein
MQLSNVKRIIVEDFKSDDRELVAKLAVILNSFMDEVVQLSRKNIDYDNRKPIGVNQINTNLKTYRGKNILDIQSLKAGTANVISTPYLDCTPQGRGIVTINRFFGLPANTKLRITIEFIG